MLGLVWLGVVWCGVDGLGFADFDLVSFSWLGFLVDLLFDLIWFDFELVLFCYIFGGLIRFDSV